MEAFDKMGLDVASMLVPWIAILISISAAFWFKDFATNFMQGLKFRFNPAFNEGDEVLLDGEQSIIVKIGLRETVFGCYGTRGYTWRYVANDKIPNLKLEKIINKASDSAARCVEIASGSPLTEEELNGTPNRECPSFWPDGTTDK